MDATSRASLANRLTWRDKLGPSTDHLFPKPDGTAWRRKENLANWLRTRVVDKFPWWSPNLARYWGINARLIDSGFDAYRLAEWTSHSSFGWIKDHYAPRARALKVAYGDRWVAGAFQKILEECPGTTKTGGV
jgi:hypothetical protein